MRVGYFHFGFNHADPIGTLRSSLSDARKRAAIDGSLIVLPEGFNIGTFYATENAQCNFSPNVLSALMALSKDYSGCFVAGLIIRETGGPQHPKPPFSSAYLVDRAEWRLISRKRLADNFTDHYTPCETHFDVAQPIEHARSRIAALICRDFCEDYGSERVQKLQHDESCTLLCVPACTNRILESVQRGSLVTKEWPNKTVVMANSHQFGNSLITDRAGLVTRFSTGAQNEICVLDD